MPEKDVEYVPSNALAELGVRCANEIFKVKNDPKLESTLKARLTNDWWTAVSANMQLQLKENPENITQRDIFKEFHGLACKIWHEERITLTLRVAEEGKYFLNRFLEE